MNILILSVTILSHAGDTLDVRYGSKPVIDGVINSLEWSDADTIVTLNLLDGPVTVYFKEYPDTLYFALAVPDSTNNPNNDRVILYFDSLNNGGSTPQTDDFGCQSSRNGNLSEVIGNGSTWQNSTVTGWNSAATSMTGLYTIEYGLSYNKLGLVPGIQKGLGFCLKVVNQSHSTIFWPDLASDTIPNTWADMCSRSSWGQIDATGPIVVSVSASPPNPPEGTNEIVIYATISDSSTGMTTIRAGETFLDSIGQTGTGNVLFPLDGNYDEIIETVFDTFPVSGWAAGDTHTFYVHGKDSMDNWGYYESLKVYVTPQTDTIPPWIAYTYPDSADQFIFTNTWIYVIFTERLDPVTVTQDKIHVEGNIGGNYSFWWSYSISDSTLSINPYNDFAPYESVSVYISAGLKDLAGNEMTTGYWWWFKTGGSSDTTKPRIDSLALAPYVVSDTGFTVLTAKISDNTKIQHAEYFIDSIGASGSGYSAHAIDSFGQPVVYTRDTIVVDTLGQGSHRVFFHGADVSGNWSPYDTADFYKASFDSTRPVFVVAVNPSTVILGDSVQIDAVANEPLHPDSAVACSIRTAERTIYAELTSNDSLSFSAWISTIGLSLGTCWAKVYGYNLSSGYGSDSVSFNITTTGEFLPAQMVYAWPNPARTSDRVYFHYYVNANADVTVDVFNLEGIRIWRGTGAGLGGNPPHTPTSNTIEWNISNVASDIYIFRILAENPATGEKKAVVKKFAIVK